MNSIGKLLTVALLSLIPALATAQPAPPPHPRSISVSGEAIANLPPDQAILRITVQNENAQLIQAKDENNRRLKKALSVAKDAGLTDAQIQLSHASISPQYDYSKSNGRPTLRGYMVSNGLTLKLKEAEKAAMLIDTLTKEGIDVMNGIEFGLSDEKKARDDLLEKAIEDARSKAQRIATAVGGKLGRAMAVTESGVSIAPQPPRPMMARADMMMAKGMEASPTLPGGEIQVRQNVEVVFELE